MTESTPEEQAVLDDLALALRAQDDVDPRHREAARAAFAWRTIDDELMELTYDSLLTPTMVRSAGVTAATHRVLQLQRRQHRAGDRRRAGDGPRAPRRHRHRGDDQRRRRAARVAERRGRRLRARSAPCPGPCASRSRAPAPPSGSTLSHLRRSEEVSAATVTNAPAPCDRPVVRLQHRPDAAASGDPGLGQQLIGGESAADAVLAHPGRDQPGDERGRERRTAPLRQPGELPLLADVRRLVAEEGAGRVAR